MKKLLVLAAGLLQVPIIRRAREMGYYVIAADGNPHAVGLALADKAVVANIVSEEEMLEIARAEKIDGVIHPCSEVSMAVMGRINDEMGLHGISRQTALRATNKHLMREAFEQYGAPSPMSFCTADVYEGWSMFQSIPGNAILKPSRNSGSRGVAKIEKGVSFEEFKGQFFRSKSESRDDSVMVEQFVEGPEFSVEIIVWEGKINVLQVTDKKTTETPYFVELGHNQPSVFPDEIVNAVRSAAVRGVEALRLEDCAAHAEVKYQDGHAYLMEIGARLGGDFISTVLTRLSTGVDMVAAAIDVSMGIEPDLNPVATPSGVCIRYFCPSPGVVESISGTEALSTPDVYDSELYCQVGDTIPEVRSSLDRSGHLIVTAPTAREAIRRADEIIEKVVFVTEKEL